MYSLKEKHISEYTKEEIISILSKYIQEQIELSRRKTLDEDSFTNASWSEYQAFQLGMQKAFQKVVSFLPDRENISD